VIRLIVALLLTSLLSGCVLHPPMQIADPAQLTHWLAEGKMGLRVADRGGNLYFTWQQEGTQYTLTLSGPLGAGRTELVGTPEGVVLRNSDTGEVSASSPELLLEAVTGYQAPVSYLAHWLKAQPATRNAVIEKDEEGRARKITEDGWTAIFAAWDTGYPALPQKILITGPDTRLTVIISRWLPAAAPVTASTPALTP
jgi:outer membrane lipoprotein LolB